MTLFLQIFLLINVFIIGMLAAIAWRHAYAHFRPHKHEPEQPRPAPNQVHLSAEARAHLQQQAEINFKTALDHTAADFKRDLATTAERLNKLLERMSTEIVGDELERYRHELAVLRKHAEADLGVIRGEVAKHQEELKAQLAKEIAAEKEQLIQQIDTKLADAVAAFLLETLGHDVDLGAQIKYLTAMLEEHKEDFKKELTE